MTCSPAGEKRACAPGLIARLGRARMVITCPTIRLSWIEARAASGLLTATSVSATRPRLTMVRYAAPPAPTIAGRIQAPRTAIIGAAIAVEVHARARMAKARLAAKR